VPDSYKGSPKTTPDTSRVDIFDTITKALRQKKGLHKATPF
jgi:hypothetical protein